MILSPIILEDHKPNAMDANVLRKGYTNARFLQKKGLLE